ncbi:hypothetical protein, partial [Ralstonia pseudosolanacearum]|uniref:hypothetical protein n=1 Tax=Ralstonia pseudosolanacearum TaxID=1310165 RepID=UPI003D165C68
ITTKLALFLLLVQYAYAEYFELDVLMCKQKCGEKEDPAQCDKECLQPYKDWVDKEITREEENVFVFHGTRWGGPLDDQDGYINILQRFEARSDMFQEIRNYRLVLSRANPGTFLSPSHRNVDSVAVVINGRASITLIHQGNKETHNVKYGDIIRIRAGTIVHYVNPDDDLQLFNMIELTINTPD